MGIFSTKKGIEEFDYADNGSLKAAETFVTIELLNRGYNVIVDYEGSDMCQLTILDDKQEKLFTIRGVNYVDAILNAGAQLHGVN